MVTERVEKNHRDSSGGKLTPCLSHDEIPELRAENGIVYPSAISPSHAHAAITNWLQLSAPSIPHGSSDAWI